MKYVLILMLTGVLLLSCARRDIFKKKYQYEVCIYLEPKEKPVVLKNETIGIVDSIVACIYGTIYDYENQALGFASLHLTSLTDSSFYGVILDSLGKFNLKLPADKYTLTALFTGYTSLIIEELQLETGELSELKLQLGNGGTFMSYLIHSNRQLNQRQLNKIKKRLRRKG